MFFGILYANCRFAFLVHTRIFILFKLFPRLNSHLDRPELLYQKSKQHSIAYSKFLVLTVRKEIAYDQVSTVTRLELD